MTDTEKLLPWWDHAIRAHADRYGPSGGAWNISMVLDCLHHAHPQPPAPAATPGTDGKNGTAPANPMGQPPAPQDDEDELGDGSDYGITPIPKSDAGEAVGEPAASAPPASGAAEDDLVEAAEDAVFGWLSVEERADFLAFMAAHDAPLIAERDAALAKLAAAEAREGVLKRRIEQIKRAAEHAPIGQAIATILAHTRAALATKEETP